MQGDSSPSPGVNAANVLCLEVSGEGQPSLADALRGLGHAVTACGTPAEAAGRLVDQPHIVVAAHEDAEVNMAFIDAVRRSPDTARVPILMTVPAPGGIEAMARAVDAGADDCLPQPVDMRLLALRMRALQRIASVQSRLAGVIDNVSEGIVTIDGRGLIKSFNKAACTMFGHAAHEVIGRNVSMLMPSPHREAHDGYVHGYLRTREPRVIGKGRRLPALRKDGTEFTIQLTVTVVAGAREPTFVGLLRDLSHEERQSALERAALHDSLTGLPNRAHFQAGLDAACKGIDGRAGPFALLFVDLDRFKQINDAHGHAAGDQVLVAIARRLRHVVQDHDLVARLGGDEFVVLLPGVSSRASAARIAGRVAHAIAAPIAAGGAVFDVGASIGIALHGPDGTTPQQLLRSADQAMYASKRGARAACAARDRFLSMTERGGP